MQQTLMGLVIEVKTLETLKFLFLVAIKVRTNRTFLACKSQSEVFPMPQRPEGPVMASQSHYRIVLDTDLEYWQEQPREGRAHDLRECMDMTGRVWW